MSVWHFCSREHRLFSATVQPGGVRFRSPKQGQHYDSGRCRWKSLTISRHAEARFERRLPRPVWSDTLEKRQCLPDHLFDLLLQNRKGSPRKQLPEQKQSTNKQGNDFYVGNKDKFCSLIHPWIKIVCNSARDRHGCLDAVLRLFVIVQNIWSPSPKRRQGFNKKYRHRKCITLEKELRLYRFFWLYRTWLWDNYSSIHINEYLMKRHDELWEGVIKKTILIKIVFLQNIFQNVMLHQNFCHFLHFYIP